jgi:hypothetical protein
MIVWTPTHQIDGVSRDGASTIGPGEEERG